MHLKIIYLAYIQLKKGLPQGTTLKKETKQTEIGFRRQHFYTDALFYICENIKIQFDQKNLQHHCS